MWRNILKYGLIAGLVVAIPMNLMMVTMHDHAPLAWGMVFGYVTMLVALSAVFIAIIMTFIGIATMSPATRPYARIFCHICAASCRVQLDWARPDPCRAIARKGDFGQIARKSTFSARCRARARG